MKADPPSSKMAFVSAQGPTVVDQTTLMKKYLQFVAALTDVNTRKIQFFLYCKLNHRITFELAGILKAHLV